MGDGEGEKEEPRGIINTTTATQQNRSVVFVRCRHGGSTGIRKRTSDDNILLLLLLLLLLILILNIVPPTDTCTERRRTRSRRRRHKENNRKIINTIATVSSHISMKLIRSV